MAAANSRIAFVFELPAWSRSVRVQLQQMSRYYFFDCGVLNAILGEQLPEVCASTRRFGALFENFVIDFSQAQGTLLWNGANRAQSAIDDLAFGPYEEHTWAENAYLYPI